MYERLRFLLLLFNKKFVFMCYMIVFMICVKKLISLIINNLNTYMCYYKPHNISYRRKVSPCLSKKYFFLIWLLRIPQKVKRYFVKYTI